jgi:hypothetical protein
MKAVEFAMRRYVGIPSYENIASPELLELRLNTTLPENNVWTLFRYITSPWVWLQASLF